jgi:EmrB/QacA subfamily drug resistance transporter
LSASGTRPQRGTLAHPYVVFAVTALALLMGSVDGTIVNVGLRTMEAELNTNIALLGWTLTGYTLTQTIIMPLAGKLSDEWGRKRLFLGAVAVFTISSAAAGLAPNVYFLIVFRVLQAIGGGAFLPSATGIVSDAFGERRGTAIGLFTSIFPLGGIIGPNLGGFLLDHTTWRWIFYVNVPIGVLLLVMGLFVLPASRPAASQRKVDVMGASYFAAAMFGVLYGMTNLATNSNASHDPVMWISFGTGLLMLVLFLSHEMRTPAPMIELELLKWRPFAAANAYNFLYGVAAFGLFSFIPYYASYAYNMTPGESGLILTPRSIAMASMSTVSSFLLFRAGYRKPMILGVLVVAASLVLMSRGFHDVVLFGWHMPNLLMLALIVTLSGLGVGIGGPASNNASLDLVPEKVAAVAGLRGMFRSTGGTLGTAAITLYLSHQPDPGIALQHIFLALAVVLCGVIPFVFLIPERGEVLIGRPAEEGAAGGVATLAEAE